LFVDWLTLVTEFIGMTTALAIFGVPAWLTVLGVCLLMGFMVLNGRYWTWEKLAMAFCAINLIYIPGAFMVNPSVSEIMRQGIIPNFPGGFTGELFFFLMANIGTTIAPWMLFFQQSSVVDKGLGVARTRSRCAIFCGCRTATRSPIIRGCRARARVCRMRRMRRCSAGFGNSFPSAAW